MIPWGVLGAAAAAVALQQQRNKGFTPDNAPWYVMFGFLLVPMLFLAAIMGGGVGFGLAGAGLLALLLFPWTLVERICVPLGLVKTAYWLGTAADLSFSRDYRGAGALGGARALFFAPVEQQPALRAFLEERLRKHGPMRGAAVVATALLEINAGRVKEGRAMLRLVDRLHDGVTPPKARGLAAEWLALEAVEEGNWTVAITACAGTLWRTPLTRLLAGIGAYLQPMAGITPPKRLALWWRWWRAPRRDVTRAWVERALQGTPPSEPAAQATPAGFDAQRVALPKGKTAALAVAVAHHAWLTAQQDKTLARGELERLVTAWEAALRDPGTLAWCTERAVTLQAHGDAHALKMLEDQVVEELTQLCRERQLAVGEPEGHGVGSRVAWDVRNGLLSDVETVVRGFGARTSEERALPPADEWRAYNALRLQVEEAVGQGGESLARLLFPTLQDQIGDYAVWLWNKRKERLLAHDIFKWLRDLARAVGDERAAELQEKNVACGV